MPEPAGRAANDPLKDVSGDKYDEWFEASPDPWQALATMEFGADRTVAFAAESAVWISDDAQRADLEKNLLAALEKSAGRPAATIAICRLLAMVGTTESVPALAQLLKNPATASSARLALEPIPGEPASVALRNALPELSGPELAGLIGSVAARRDNAARPALEKIARASNQPSAIRTAAQNALAALAP